MQSRCSALIKQACLNKAKNKRIINSENDFYNHFKACKLYCRETWKEENVIINGFQSILKNK